MQRTCKLPQDKAKLWRGARSEDWKMKAPLQSGAEVWKSSSDAFSAEKKAPPSQVVITSPDLSGRSNPPKQKLLLFSHQ